MSKPNKFAVAIDEAEEQPAQVAAAATVEPSPPAEPVVKAKSPRRPSRLNTRHIGGHYSPTTSKMMNQLALDEDTSVQQLLAEAIDMLFHSRQLPTVASQPKKS